ncbi:hypothetical protein BTA51_11315 [Hahella sp. CCB-MM4]|uniref:type VI secretion IcmF C-terminal domain-containing protein n=1 Tax=Hahella sp. (strain CCB-MM4) TaxID=1926491 RepID=UPI000BDAA221|nr:type VI secretion IcmF C-terminal domain-containing protein [Hahella sp. CCB-MM4]OZG73079.1 hypothetical protein BTA51_11315 [Hahella sp. CCB-MM4]
MPLLVAGCSSYGTTTQDGAKSEIEEQWRNKVYPECAALKERYPFSPDASKEVSLTSFEDYFGPGGTWQSFYQEYLQAYWGDNGESTKTSTTVFSDDFVKQVNAGRLIQRAFFSENGPRANYRMSFKPSTMSPSIRRVLMNVGGTEGPSTLGPRLWAEVSWPTPSPGAKLVVERLNGDSKGYEFAGDWALFRMLNKAHITLDSNESGQARFDFDELNVIYQIKVAHPSSLNVFQALSEYHCPETIQ